MKTLQISLESIILSFSNGKHFFSKVIEKDYKVKYSVNSGKNVEKLFPSCYSFER